MNMEIFIGGAIAAMIINLYLYMKLQGEVDTLYLYLHKEIIPKLKKNEVGELYGRSNRTESSD